MLAGMTSLSRARGNSSGEKVQQLSLGHKHRLSFTLTGSKYIVQVHKDRSGGGAEGDKIVSSFYLYSQLNR